MSDASAAGDAARNLAAPAKLNLGLRIVGRRPDGYHELESLFVPLELADAVALEAVERATAPEVDLRVAGASGGVPAGPDNLVARAARAFLQAAGLSVRVRLALTKRVPPASGLGGGSSDAAAALRLLAAQWPERPLVSPLSALALALGADVPFFLDPAPAAVSGIGERIDPVAGLPALPVALLRPAEGLPTEAVYRAYAASGVALTPPGKGPTVRALAALVEGADGGSAGGELLANDLEAPARRLCPQIADLRALLHDAGARAVGLSGSGPVVFGIFATLREARAAVEGAAATQGEALWTWAGNTLPSR